ncbi:TPA: ATP-dependent endonuclease, partial [Pseudomonas aeruginosa]
LEGNNLARMFEAASSNWPTHGPVKNGLHARSELKFAEMGNQERANYAWELLERIDSDDMGKGLYAQILADELAANRESEFLVPDYIRDAVLWACELNK